MRCLLFLLLFLSASVFASEHKERIEIYKSIDKALFTGEQDWRKPLVRWAYRFIKHLDLSPLNVSQALEIYDHFLLKKQVADHTLYFTASLALAIKLQDKPVKFRVFELLSTGRYTTENYRKAETEICEALRWKTMYITPDKYLNEYFNYICKSGFSNEHKRLVKRIEARAYYYSRQLAFESKKDLRSVDIAKVCLVWAIKDFYTENGLGNYLLDLVNYLLD